MKVVIVPETKWPDTPGWSWWIDGDSGRSIAKGNTYVARADAIGAALRVLGLVLPVRKKGTRWRKVTSVPQPRGGTADVYVIYGAGGKVLFAEFVTLMEYIELVERTS